MARNMDKALGDGQMQLLAEVGLCFDGYGDGWAEAAWIPTELSLNPWGTVQGGVYAVVLDAAMNFATSASLDPGDRCATLDVQFQIIRAAKAGDHLTVRADVVRAAKSIAYLEASAVDVGSGEIVSKATATFLLRRS